MNCPLSLLGPAVNLSLLQTPMFWCGLNVHQAHKCGLDNSLSLLDSRLWCHILSRSFHGCDTFFIFPFIAAKDNLPPPKKKALRKTLKDFTQLLRDFSDTVVSVQGHYSLVLAYLHIESDFSQATPAWLFNRFTTIIKLNLN